MVVVAAVVAAAREGCVVADWRLGGAVLRSQLLWGLLGGGLLLLSLLLLLLLFLLLWWWRWNVCRSSWRCCECLRLRVMGGDRGAEQRRRVYRGGDGVHRGRRTINSAGEVYRRRRWCSARSGVDAAEELWSTAPSSSGGAVLVVVG